jgi:hypothetical protein
MPRAAPAALALAAALAALGAPGAARAEPRRASPEVAALVKRCVEAYGGPAAIARAARLRQEGTVTSLLHPGEQGRVLRLYERPGRLRVEVGWGGPPEVRILDGGRGWRFGEEVGGPGLVAMMLQAARLDLPDLLQAFPALVVDRGSVDLDGRTVRALALEVAPGVEVEAHLDPATGRILRSIGRATVGPPVIFGTRYQDFRVVDGLLVAFREENFANGAITGETVLTAVRVVDALPDGTFRR